MWTERYRPKTIEDVKTDRNRTLLNSIQKNPKNLPHLLLYGPPGTGKTSTAQAIANEIFRKEDQTFWVKTLNASDQRGIDVVRGPITDFCEVTAITLSRDTPRYPFKLIIPDEADAMTQDAQRDLRAKIIEHSTSKAGGPTVRFCFIANYLSKIHDAIQSRCTLVRFPPIPKHIIRDQVERVAAAEGIHLNTEVTDIIAKEAGGDLRKATHILQTVGTPYLKNDTPESSLGPTPKDTWNVLGKPTRETLNQTMKDIQEAKPNQRLKIWKRKLGRFLLIDILHTFSNPKIQEIAHMERKLLQEGGTGMPAHRAALMTLMLNK